MESWMQVEGVRLEAYFQRYQIVGDDEPISGELLTKPEGHTAPESYFRTLSLSDQFTILEWHLRLSTEMTHRLGAMVSINVHNSLVEHQEDRLRFLEILGRTTVPVMLEFTEDYPMPAMESSNAFLREIRELGHLSALDDFGTGHNGMSLLTRYDFDVVKVDRSLTGNLLTNPERRRMMRLLAQLLDTLGKQHVVEGIEDAEVYERLLDAGFTAFQGFLFYRPEPVVKLLAEASVGVDV